jgi:ABC-type transporter Mla subunit MlaD
MNRRRSSSVASNPTLIGAITLLVTLVAVFLAYNANHGLPFVPTREYRVQLASGANVLPGGDVKVGGQRVGVIDRLRPVRTESGETGAELVVRLDEAAADVPVDSTWRVRPRSPLGLKYLELTRGKSDRLLRDGDTVLAASTASDVELADYLGIFDAKTREGVRKVLDGTGEAFASRGADLNHAIGEAPRLLRHLEPVARTLADPDTRLRRMFRELGDTVRVVAPVADRYARSFSTGAETFEAFSRDEQALADTIVESVPALEAAIPSLRAQRPMLTAVRDSSRALGRLAAVLPDAAPPLAAALEDGVPNLRRSVPVYEALTEDLSALGELVRDPATSASFVGLERLGDILRPVTRHVGPYVTVCNYLNYSFTHLGEHVSEPDATGTMQRTLNMQASRTVNPTHPSLGTLGASQAVNGEPTLTGVPMHFHGQAYGAAVSPTGEADCEAGQRGYMERLHHYNLDPNFKVVRDSHVPGNQGTTWTGRPRVPAGQTFDRNPRIGPPLPPEVDHP